MQKLVVEIERDLGYSAGAYSVITCLEYESVLALENLFRQVIEKYISESLIFISRSQAWEIKNIKLIKKAMTSKANSKVRIKLDVQILDHRDDKPKELNNKFKIQGHSFKYEDFFIDHGNIDISCYKSPMILTLEDWFEYKKDNLYNEW